ncbi:MAG: hypothetical protein RBT06_06375 [Smithellaceae bacterium]|nr:hypothetical protein [Smithellaceae bacterium]
MAIIDKNLFRKVEGELYNYQRNLRKLNEARLDILYGGAERPTAGSMPEGHISDPTGAKGRAMAGLLDSEQGRWTEVMHDTFQMLPRELKMLVKYKYFDGMRNEETAMRLHISRSLFYEWREEVIIRIVLLATQRDLVTPIRERRENRTA